MHGRVQIAEAYLGPGSAGAVAARLNEQHDTDYFTVSRVLHVWDAMYRESVLLRSLKPRPLHGFDPKDERVQLAQAFLAAA